ncbi:MAG: SLBB domain-containing protein, partial [Acidobacteriota bacterium]|nr:SLBB domain-containing protein [Acidobacteriota bacterium]
MRNWTCKVFEIAWLLALGAILANGQIAARVQTDAANSSPDSFSELNDLIHFGDLVEVDVVGSTEFDWRGEVTPEGTLGGLNFTESPIIALCRKGSDVALEIARSYSKFLNTPQVTVDILDRSNRPFAVLTGAVRKPQRFKLLKDVTLRELIVFSGGFSENAEGRIEIRRQPAAACVGLPGEGPATGKSAANSVAGPETEFREIKIGDILSGKFDPNFAIRYGDFLIVKSALPVYVIGNVPRPGRISMSEGLTVGRAVAAAGGLSDKIETAD